MSYEYIDTDVEYIGTIPKTWDLVRNKHLFNKTKVIVGPNWDKYNVLSLTKKGVIIKDIENNQGKMPSDFSIYQLVNPGNLLMCLFDIDVTPRCVGYIENKGIVSAAYTELAPVEEIDMKYYYWWYLMLDIDKQLLHLSKNLRNSLSTEDFMALSVVKPPIKEQQQIANYLDKQTAKIDATIAKNEELIELLEEKRVALINQIVTKGLNPDVPMKDSGVEWIGEIPEHWDITPLKRFVKLNNGKEITIEVEKDDENAIGVYGSGGLFKYTNEYLFKGESVLFGRKGTLGKPIYLNDVFWTVDTMYYLSFTPLMYPKYCYYCLILYPWDKISTETAKPSVVGSDVTNSMFAIPNIKEQKQIADYLDNKISIIDKTISKIRENIHLLDEYKTSLIHHVVTGKIDVRGEEI